MGVASVTPEVQPSPVAWSCSSTWNADFLAKCLQILVNSPAAGAFMKPTLDGRANFMMAEAVKMAEEMATGLLQTAGAHTVLILHQKSEAPHE